MRPEVGVGFAGRVAVVTGAGRGIGRAIALALAERGVQLVVHYRSSERGAQETATAARALGVRAETIAADLAHVEACAQVVDGALKAFGRLDLLINNAGRYSTAPFPAVTTDLWDQTLAINLRAAFFLCQAAAGPLTASGDGVIVNLASGGGLSPRPGFPVSAPYAASKAGLVMLTRVLALELAPSVRVNAVAPGVIHSKRKPMPPVTYARFAAITPLRRVGEPGDVADAVVFLASDAARFITGQVLSVDGGLVMV
jgi:3-oxoacyl-[acyl-carrier protein] reductase